MKLANNLIEQIAEPDNLRLAFHKATQGKRYSSQVKAYRAGLDAQLLALRDQLLQEKVEVGDYRYFKVYDPKERQICASAFSEQVLHHALMNVCHPCFERTQIFDSYASRPGKGVHAALRRSFSFHREGYWFLKLDIRKFFASIDHLVLKRQLYRLFKDKSVLRLFSQIIDTYEDEPRKGLPIGNLTSQYFANHYLSELDHFIKEQLYCKSYVRYMDDLVVWDEDKGTLMQKLSVIKRYVEDSLHLRLKLPQLNKAERGLPFCGYILYPHYIRLSRRSKRRYIKKIKLLDEMYRTGEWSEASCQRRAQSIVAFTRHADALQFRKNNMQSLSIQ